MKKEILYALELMKAFWNSSITMMWAFIPILLLTTYKIELISLEPLLLELRMFLLRTWEYFWIAFFITNSYTGIKSITSTKPEANK